MNVYLESSAALRDLLEGDRGGEIRALLVRAERVAASRLTLAEVARTLARLRVLEPTVAARIALREGQFLSDSQLWNVQPIDEEVLARSGRPFPVEPVRVLDAIHLATVERFAAALPDLVVLSTDERVRKNADALGFAVRP